MRFGSCGGVPWVHWDSSSTPCRRAGASARVVRGRLVLWARTVEARTLQVLRAAGAHGKRSGAQWGSPGGRYGRPAPRALLVRGAPPCSPVSAWGRVLLPRWGRRRRYSSPLPRYSPARIVGGVFSGGRFSCPRLVWYSTGGIALGEGRRTGATLLVASPQCQAEGSAKRMGHGATSSKRSMMMRTWSSGMGLSASKGIPVGGRLFRSRAMRANMRARWARRADYGVRAEIDHWANDYSMERVRPLAIGSACWDLAEYWRRQAVCALNGYDPDEPCAYLDFEDPGGTVSGLSPAGRRMRDAHSRVVCYSRAMALARAWERAARGFPMD